MTTSSAEPARLEAYPEALTGADEDLTALTRDLDEAMTAFADGAGAYLPGGFDPAWCGDLVRGLRDESQYLAGWVAHVGAAFRAADADADGDGLFTADDAFLAGWVGAPTLAEAMTIPPAGTDPAEVARWWATLPLPLRERLIQEDFAQLGTLRGLPAEDVDRVNRLRLAADIDRLRGELAVVAPEVNGQMHTPSGQVEPELQREYDRLRHLLGNAEKIADQMDALDDAYQDGSGPRPYLLTYGYQNDGRFAVALGNPDTADNTAVVVPGTGHDVTREAGLFSPVNDGRRLYDQMGVQSGSDGTSTGPGATRNAVIVWMGADMPDHIPDATNPTYGDAEHGARWLRDDVAGYRAAHAQAASGNTHMPADDHLTVVSHSYGSYLSGEAIRAGMEVDDFVSIGSAGLHADDPGDLGMSPDHVWAGAADDDPVPDLQWHGNDPADADFGGRVISTDGSIGHSEYYEADNPGPEDDGDDHDSLENLGRIAVGRYDDVELRPPDDAEPLDRRPRRPG